MLIRWCRRLFRLQLLLLGVFAAVGGVLWLRQPETMPYGVLLLLIAILLPGSEWAFRWFTYMEEKNR